MMMDEAKKVAKEIVQRIVDTHGLHLGELLEDSPLMRAIDEGRQEYLHQCSWAGHKQYYNQAVIDLILNPRIEAGQ